MILHRHRSQKNVLLQNMNNQWNVYHFNIWSQKKRREFQGLPEYHLTKYKTKRQWILWRSFSPSFVSPKSALHKQSLNGQLHRLNLRLQLRALLYGDRCGNDGTRHPTRTAQGLLGAHKHVWDVLVFAEQRQVKNDLQWFRISSHHNELWDAPVQGLGGWRRGD